MYYTWYGNIVLNINEPKFTVQKLNDRDKYMNALKKNTWLLNYFDHVKLKEPENLLRPENTWP